MTLAGWVGAVVLVAVASWIASPAADVGFRRMFPKVSAALVGAAASASTAAVIVAVTAPSVAVVAAAVVVVALLTGWARAAVGRGRGEPPGDRSPVAWVRDLARRDAYQRRFDRHGPVVVGSQFGRSVVCIHGIERGQRLLREHRSAVGPSPLPFTQQMMGDFLRYMDDETHDRYGPMFRRALSREVTDAVRPAVTTATGAMLTEVGADPVDPRPAVRRIVETALVQAWFGVARDAASTDPLVTAFVTAFHAFSARPIQHRADRAARSGLADLRSITRRLAAVASAPGAPPNVLSGIMALDPDQPDDVAVDNLAFMLRIGTANTAALAAWGLQLLAGAPEIRRRLAGGEAGLADAVVNETLRLAQSEYLYRRLRHDVDFDGYRLRAGWLVRICVAESHRDPERFECPAAFTDRFVGDRPPQHVFAPFGVDRHACNASGLAIGIVGTVLTAVAADPAVRIVPATDVVRDLRHWSHWRPGPGLALTRANPTDPSR